MKIPKPTKKPKAKRKFRSDRKKLVDELDRVFSLYVRARDKKCVLAGRTPYLKCSDNLQCGHVFGRGHYSTRWDDTNAFAQCGAHNREHNDNARPFYEWYEERFGMEALNILHLKYVTPRKFTDAELVEMIEKYRHPHLPE